MAEDIFKEEMNKEGSLKEKEIIIKVNPMKILKIFLFILLLVVVFYAGRFSVTGLNWGSFVGGDGVTAEVTSEEPVVEVVAEEIIEEAAEEANNTTEEETTEETTNTTEETTNTTEETTNTTEEVAVEEEAEDEVVVTTYKKVTMDIVEPYTKWYGTWGKVTGLKVTIKNSESGTVKPFDGLMLMEGYGDFSKNIVLPIKLKSLKAGETATADVTVTDGFSYNPNTAGNLEDVKITLSIYDEEDRVVAQDIKKVNLEE